MFDLIVDITKVYLTVVGILILIDLLSFLISNWTIVVGVTLILALLLAVFLLVLPVVIVVKVIKALF